MPLSPRIVIFCHSGSYSGAEVVLERIIAAAVDQGWPVTVVIPQGPARQRFRLAGATIKPGPDFTVPLGSRAIGLAHQAVVSLRAARLLRKEAAAADLVLINSIHAVPALALARLEVPSVWLLHQVIVSRFRLAMVRATRAAGFHTIAVSDAAAAPLRAMGFDVTVIHNGTPSPVPPAPDRPGRPAVVGCAAALTPWKGQHVVLEALAALDPQVHLELLGQAFAKDASYERRLRARAARPDLAGRVRFLGFRDDVLDVMRSWSVAVSASTDPEAVGLTTLEAMSLGIPVVGTNLGATPDIVGDAGLLVPPGDPGALADAITTILSDEDRWTAMHRAGPRIVAERFDVRDQIDAVLDRMRALSSPPAPTRRAEP